MALDYLIEFAGVPFVTDDAVAFRMSPPSSQHDPPRKHQPLESVVDEIDRLMPFQYLKDWTLPGTWPGRALEGIAWSHTADPQPNPQIKTGDWFYPTGACRWSVFRGLATSSMAKAMLDASHLPLVSQSEPRVPRARDFTMRVNPTSPGNPADDYRRYTVTTSMRMLPPRPLAEHGGGMDGLFLITLVDERYWFQGTPVVLRPDGSKSWDDLAASLAAALGITLFQDPVAAPYGRPEPDSPLWATMQNAAVLLDAVAWNTGRVTVRNLNGTYELQSWDSARTAALANRARAGGA